MIPSTQDSIDESQVSNEVSLLLNKSVGAPSDIVVPEETVFGVVSRYHQLSGHSTAGDTLAEFNSSRTVSLSTLFPSNLPQVFSHLQLPFETVEEFIEYHTAIPYFRIFSDAARWTRIAESISRGNAKNAKICLGILASRIGAEDVLRYCPECAKADLEVIGTSTWYRVHQLPGVLFCPYHGIQLVSLLCLAQRLKRQQLFLPEQALKWKRDIDISIDNHLTRKRLLLVARLSAQLLTSQKAPLGPKTLQGKYLHHLATVGLATAKLRVRRIELKQDFTNFWSSLRETEPFASLLDRCDSANSWLNDLLIRSRSTHHPLKHVLMIGYLNGKLDSFLSVGSQETFAIVRPSLRSTHGCDTEVNDLLMQGHSLHQIAEKSKLSINSVLVRAERMGFKIKRRPKKLDDELLSTIKDLLRTGTLISEIMSQTKLSSSTINRILMSSNSLQIERTFNRTESRRRLARNNLLIAVKSNPDASFKGLRLSIPADFAWLYRHDRLWLTEQIRPKDRVLSSHIDWNARDVSMCSQVQQAVSQILNTLGRPTRISRNEIGRRTNHASWLDKHLAKLPNTKKLLLQVLESAANYRMRRNAWQVQKSSLL